MDDYVINLLTAKIGTDVKTPRGASMLRNAIETEVGEHLALNTVKRLLGILPYDYSPRTDTLAIIAKYLGFGSWQLLQDYVNDKISQFGDTDPFLELGKLPADALIEVTWEPDRIILLRHIQNDKFLVEKAENSKLQQGDILSLSSLSIGFPFMAKSVVRNRENLGSYTAAKELGVKELRLH